MVGVRTAFLVPDHSPFALARTPHRSVNQRRTSAWRCCQRATGKDAVLLVDHGSRRAEANNMLTKVASMVHEQARETRAPVDMVVIAHMELASPTIAEGLADCVERGATRVSVVPYFLAPGRHSTDDIPRMVNDAIQGMGAKADGVEVVVKAPLGVHPKIGEVVLERAGVVGSE